MELDDLKTAWAAHGAVLERSLAINERLLRETLLGKVRRRLVPFVVMRAFEIACGLVLLFLLAPVVVAHVREARYLVVGAPVIAFLAGITATTIYTLVQTVRLDYDGPVIAIRRSVEELKRVEYRATKWAVLGGVLVWLPVLLLLLEAVTGSPALARIDLGYLAANLALGIVVLGAGLALSRRYVERPGARAHRLIDALAGSSLNAARRELDALARYEQPEP